MKWSYIRCYRDILLVLIILRLRLITLFKLICHKIKEAFNQSLCSFLIVLKQFVVKRHTCKALLRWINKQIYATMSIPPQASIHAPELNSL